MYFYKSSCYKDNHFYSFLQHAHVTRYKIFNNFQIIQVIPIKIKISVPNHPILIKPHHHIKPYILIQFNGWVVLLQSVILIEIKITGLFYPILKNVNYPFHDHAAIPFNGTPSKISAPRMVKCHSQCRKIWGWVLLILTTLPIITYITYNNHHKYNYHTTQN